MPAGTLKPRYLLLYLLLATDLAFIILYGLCGFHIVSDPKFGLIEDWSYGEVFQYIKEFWIVLLLVFLAVRQRSVLYFGWSLLFTFLLLDDSIQIHERLGAWMAARFGFSSHFGLRAVDFGEIVGSAAAGVVFLAVITTAYLYGDKDSKSASRSLFCLLLALVFFGVGVDMVPGGLPWLLEKAIGALEDGGEQVVMSVIVWFSFVLTAKHLQPRGCISPPISPSKSVTRSTAPEYDAELTRPGDVTGHNEPVLTAADAGFGPANSEVE